MQLNEEIKKAYFDALYNQQNGCNAPMLEFKESYPGVYKIINAMYHKRMKVLKNIRVLRKISNNKVYFGALTFNDLKDKNQRETKRKEVFKFLNTIFLCFLVVEEEGELNGRYHCHYVGIFKEGKTFNDLYKWHSREDCQRVKSARSVAKYLCDYVVKQVPRIRRNKALVKVYEEMKECRKWAHRGFYESVGVIHERKINEILFLSDIENELDLI